MIQFDSMHYVPILRWKQAEQTALAQLYEHDSIYLTPLVELVPENFIHKDPKGHITNLSINEVVNRVGGQLFRYWGERPVFIDLWLLSPDILNQGSNHFLALLGQYARTLKLSLIPVTGIARDGTYQSAVRTVLGIHSQGACLRLSVEDIKRPTLAKDINNLLSLLQLRPEFVDLIVDFKIIEHSAPTFNILCELIPGIDRWRNFIIASGAFPEDLSGLRKNDIYRLPRTDWISWRDQAMVRPSVMHLPIYSDYTIQYPRYQHRTGPLNYSASIRYTADDYWVIMRGESVSAENSPGRVQWPANALLLCEQPEYCGDTFSYGDSYIKEKSREYDKPGNTTTWLRAGINHHMTFVARQLASLLGTSTAAVP